MGELLTFETERQLLVILLVKDYYRQVGHVQGNIVLELYNRPISDAGVIF